MVKLIPETISTLLQTLLEMALVDIRVQSHTMVTKAKFPAAAPLGGAKSSPSSSTTNLIRCRRRAGGCFQGGSSNSLSKIDVGPSSGGGIIPDTPLTGTFQGGFNRNWISGHGPPKPVLSGFLARHKPQVSPIYEGMSGTLGKKFGVSF